MIPTQHLNLSPVYSTSSLQHDLCSPDPSTTITSMQEMPRSEQRPTDMAPLTHTSRQQMPRGEQRPTDMAPSTDTSMQQMPRGEQRPTDMAPSTHTSRQQMPRATPEVLLYLKSLVAYLEDGSMATPSSTLRAEHYGTVGAAVLGIPDCSRQKPTIVTGSNDLPFPLPQPSDPTLLHVGHEVEISKSARSILLKKYSENPEEMTRQLIICLVGNENLKIMRPRCHGESKFRPIPVHIMAAIDDFVLHNTKLTTFTKSKLTKVVSNYVNRLRSSDKECAQKSCRGTAETRALKEFKVAGRSKHSRGIDSHVSITGLDSDSMKRSNTGSSPSRAYQSPAKRLTPRKTAHNTTYSARMSPQEWNESTVPNVVATHNSSPWKVRPLSPQVQPVSRKLFDPREDSGSDLYGASFDRFQSVTYPPDSSFSLSSTIMNYHQL